MEIKKTSNANLYGKSEKSISNIDNKLYNAIIKSFDDDITFKEKFYMFEHSILERVTCECGEYVKFIDMKRGFREFCSKRCMYDSKKIKLSRKNTNLERYGVDNPSKSDDIRKKVEDTNMDKYGVKYPMQSDKFIEKSKDTFNKNYGVDNPSKLRKVREKAENTMLKKYGVRHAMQSDEFIEKSKKTFVENYGVDNPSKLREVRKKAEDTMMEKYGVKHAMQSNEFIEKSKRTNMEKYGASSFLLSEKYKKSMIDFIQRRNSELVNNDRYSLLDSDNTEYNILCNICNSEFPIQRQLYRNRLNRNEEICLVCNPISSGISFMEVEILEFLRLNYNGVIISNDRSLIGKELDIYLPDMNLAFEFNGLYWHSELFKNKSYHLDKTTDCLSKGINLIHIWEDDWLNKTNIIKSIILNKIGKSKRIFARKCHIRELDDNSKIREFLNENHIQGFVGSNIKLGLYNGDELVSLMTFGSLRKSLGQVNKIGSYELLRFCNKLNTSVVGGASKLFKYFIRNYKFNDIISYSDNSRGIGNLYNKLGFDLLKETSINYYWCKNGIKYHRFNFRKDKLVSEGYDSSKTERVIMYERGYFRVFDCGNKKWIYE